GMNEDFKPKFVKRYENLGMRIRTAVDDYCDEVRSGRFPTEDESFTAVPAPAAKERKVASVSALALAGGCAPTPATQIAAAPPAPTVVESGPAFYSSAKRD